MFHGSLTDGVWDTGCCGRVVHVFYDAMTFVRLSPASTVSLCMAWIDRGGEREARARSGGPEKGIDRADWAFLSRAVSGAATSGREGDLVARLWQVDAKRGHESRLSLQGLKTALLPKVPSAVGKADEL